MKIGVTGNRGGLDTFQRDWLVRFLREHASVLYVLFHGDCVGVDAEVHDLVRKHVPRCKIVIHPPECSDQRAFKKGDDTRDPKPYLVRNKRIVSKSALVIGFPRGEEHLRSGTWATLREARRRGKEHYIVYPGSNRVVHVPAVKTLKKKKAPPKKIGAKDPKQLTLCPVK